MTDISDMEEWKTEALINEIESLRQQLEDSSHAYDVCAQEHRRMSQQLAEVKEFNQIHKDENKLLRNEIESLRQQLVACKQTLAESQAKLVEYQAREKVLRNALHMVISPNVADGVTIKDVLVAHTDIAMEALAQPSNSTALDAAIRQAIEDERQNPWKGILIDSLVVCHILTAEHENNPKKALNDLIAWENQTALDPLVSNSAVELVKQAKREALLEAAESFDKDQPAHSASAWIGRALRDKAEELK